MKNEVTCGELDNLHKEIKLVDFNLVLCYNIINMDKNKKLFSEIQAIVGGYPTLEIEITKGLNFNMADTLRTITFYSNSKYTGGQKDELGRDKPFNNINTFRTNVAYRATDLDLKDIQIVADDITDKENMIKSMVLSKEAYKWGKNNGLSEFLNNFGYTRAKYGDVLVKKCTDDDGEMKLEVCAWKNMVVDPTNIDDSIIIEKHFFKAHELAEKQDVWDNVVDVLKKAKKTKSDIEVLEVHGQFTEEVDPDAKGDDEYTYTQKKFLIAQVGNDMFLLHSEDEKENIYRHLSWRKEEGRDFGVGIVEDGFEAQVWTNDATIAEKNAMELAGKVILKTNSKKVGSNILTDADNGRIFELEDGRDITPINLMPTALPKYAELIQRWDNQFERVSSTFNAITGEQMPSGTPYRQTAILNQEAGSLFDQRREEAGIFISELYMDWVLPYLIKKLNKEHILTAEWSNEELIIIDEGFSNYRAARKFVADVINGKDVTQESVDSEITKYNEEVKNLKNVRSIPIPKDYFKDFECHVSVIITNEMRNKSAILESLSNILAQVGSNPAMLQDPILSKVFGAIIEISGVPISPTAFIPKPNQQMQPQMPQGQGQPSPEQMAQLMQTK
jgi:hypothetical protein